MAGTRSDPIPAASGTGWSLRGAAVGRARRAALLLSDLVVALMLVASLAGLMVPGLYRDPESLSAMYRGYDLVTLVLVVPLLTGVLVGVRRGSVLAELLWVGLLATPVYTYAFYVFGSTFNDLLLVHVAVFACAGIALVLALASLDVRAIAARFGPRTPVRTVGGFLAVLALGLGGMWTGGFVRFVLTGEVPPGSALVETDAIVHLSIVLDLSLLVPMYIAGCVLVWRRAPWDYVLAAVALMSGIVQQISYLVALPFQTSAGVPGAVAFDLYEPIIAVPYVVGALLLLGSLTRRRSIRGGE
jgi:hypothetical protein